MGAESDIISYDTAFSKMEALGGMRSAGLIEKDRHGDVLWTWSYPSIENNDKELILKKCCLNNDDKESFVYGHFKRNWYYILSTECASPKLPKVTHFSLVLLTSDFHPEKYEQLCHILSTHYIKSGNPATMLESYLSVMTRGVCNSDENGSYNVKAFDQRQAHAGGPMRSVVNLFGIEVILIYTAMLLKKRIIVYHPNVKELLTITRSLPALVWHRQNWNVLFPWVHNEELEIKELKTTSCFVAGFTDMTIEARQDLYDVYVNATGPEINIAAHAKDSMAMGKLHKDIATHIVGSCDDESKSDQQIIKDITLKTKELVNNLKSLAVQDENGKDYISLDMLRERKMPRSTENFLFNLAAAEGLLKT